MSQVSLYYHLGLMLLGLVALVKGADLFVEASSRIARIAGVSEFTIGLTLVAVGTSIPELAASLSAASAGYGGLVAGTNLGANMANVGLMIGLAGILRPFDTVEEMLWKDGLIMLFVTVVLYLLVLDGDLSNVEGGVMVLLYLAYALFVAEERPEREGKYGFSEFLRYFVGLGYVTDLKRRIRRGGARGRKGERLMRREMVTDFFLLLIGVVGIAVGSQYVVDEAIWAADYFSIPSNVVGLTLLALGTSLPELGVTLTAARRGMGNILVGNVLGSNIARPTLVMGAASMVGPLDLPGATVAVTLPATLIISALLLILFWSNRRIDRRDGVILLLSYVFLLGWSLSAA